LSSISQRRAGPFDQVRHFPLRGIVAAKKWKPVKDLARALNVKLKEMSLPGRLDRRPGPTLHEGMVVQTWSGK
jgi:hypothetical protein